MIFLRLMSKLSHTIIIKSTYTIMQWQCACVSVKKIIYNNKLNIKHVSKSFVLKHSKALKCICNYIYDIDLDIWFIEITNLMMCVEAKCKGKQ